MRQNPKLVGSNMIDCVPQAGPCPYVCDQCYYNKWFYAGHEPFFPSADEARGKIVKVNSGGDSNNQRDLVIQSTERYKDRCFNTSRPVLDFPGPVILTINSPFTDEAFYVVDPPVNLMFVRFRANAWNYEMAWEAARYYSKIGVATVMTFMNYYEYDKVRKPCSYEFRLHIEHEYWRIKHDAWRLIMNYVWTADLGEGLVLTCGQPGQSLCKDCGNCERLYYETIKRIARAGGEDYAEESAC